jgi:D-tyrosyl-tRNA(Tyr) deacylase
VTSARVEVDGETVGAIEGPGLVVLLGVTHDDTEQVAQTLARKVYGLRILADEQSASDIGAPLLVVSQFTLYADTRKGRRPSWSAAAPGPVAEPLYEHFCSALEQAGAYVARGVFGAYMQVHLTGDGPVTLLVEAASDPEQPERTAPRS